MSNFFFAKIFPAMFILGGLIFMGVGVSHLLKARETSSWVPVQGMFLEKSVKTSTSRGSDGKTSTSYKPQVRYSYTVDGQEYQGTTLLVGIGGYSRPRYAHAAMEEFKVKQACEVYVDPDDPTQAVLKTGIRPVHFVFPGLGFGLMVVGIGAAILIPYAQRHEQAKKERIAAYQAEWAARHAATKESE
ncbi:MAG TPA: hypothetical protein DCY79_24005 [Planctomycetaceae bacterium]|nr:hypothetical protein [Planctomycetaceae bacterium]